MLFSGRDKKPNNQTPRTLEQYAVTVEQILDDLGVPVNEARINVEQGYGWNFSRGSAIIEVYIVDQEDRGYIQVLSPIMHLPASGLLPLYRKLLEYNLQLTNASLGIFYDVVYVFNERPLVGLDATETNTIITMVAGYADDLDNTLVSEFGGRLYSQT
jgi:hypothetical protein